MTLAPFSFQKSNMYPNNAYSLQETQAYLQIRLLVFAKQSDFTQKMD